MKKDAGPFVSAWLTKCEDAFQALKQRVWKALILGHFTPNEQYFVKMDSSDYVNAGVLSQRDDDSLLHPVAFFSRKMSLAERDYETYNKELLAIYLMFWGMKAWIQGQRHALTKYKGPEYFMMTKQLSARQARWVEFPSKFNFVMNHQSGKNNENADAITRIPKRGPQATWAAYAGIITTEMAGIWIHTKGTEENGRKTEGFFKNPPKSWSHRSWFLYTQPHGTLVPCQIGIKKGCKIERGQDSHFGNYVPCTCKTPDPKQRKSQGGFKKLKWRKGGLKKGKKKKIGFLVPAKR